jgi:cell division transport system permease protein
MSVSPANPERPATDRFSSKPLRGRHAARLVPSARLAGPIPWVIAIMIALVVIAAAGGLALRNLADNARADLSGALTVQIVEANPQLRVERANTAANILRQQPIVADVRVVPPGELRALLEPWLGAGAGSEEIPIPALIDVELRQTAGAQEIAALQEALDQSGPNVRVDAQASWLQPVYSALAALQYLALGLIILLGLACAAAVWLAARSSLANHRETVEIVHLLGGSDRQVTGIFQRSVLRDAVFGSLFGLALGLVAVWLLGQQFGALDSGMVSGGQLTWIDWLVIAAVPLAGVLLALFTGRITIHTALRKML